MHRNITTKLVILFVVLFNFAKKIYINFEERFKDFLQKEKNLNFCWIALFFIIGIIFYYYNFEFENLDRFFLKELIFKCLIFLILNLILILIYRNSFISISYILVFSFVAGFTWTLLFHNIFSYQTNIKVKKYFDAVGKVEEIKEFNSDKNKYKKGAILTLKLNDLKLANFNNSETKYVTNNSEAKYVTNNDVKINIEDSYQKKQKEKIYKKYSFEKEYKETKTLYKKLAKCNDEKECELSVRKEYLAKQIERRKKFVRKKLLKFCQEFKDKIKNCNEEVENIDSEIELKKFFNKSYINIQKFEKIHKKKRNFSKKKDAMNFADYLNLDREVMDYNKYQELPLYKIDSELHLKNFPKKVNLITYNYNGNIGYRDIILAKIALEPIKDKDYTGSFNNKYNLFSKGINASGYIISDIEVIKKNNSNKELDVFSMTFFKELNQKINLELNKYLSPKQYSVASALLTGSRIENKEVNLAIAKSGLLHLLTVSGLHMSLAASFIFVAVRFILSRVEYISLRIDTKKIAASFGIISTFVYLQISGAPVPAIRSFIMILFILIAVIIDKKTNAKRLIFFAGVLMLVFQPFLIFNISFQLSFVAILSLVVFYEIFDKFQPKNYIGKIFFYILSIIFSSIFIQITTAPILIMYFGKISVLGFLANILAIPLVSFLIMPLGFIAMLLMIINLHPLFLKANGYFIDLLLYIANYVSSLQYAEISVFYISGVVFLASIIGIMIFFISTTRLKFFGILIFICSLGYFLIYEVKKPYLIFEANQGYFAINDKEYGLIFSKKLRKSKKTEFLMTKFNESKFKIIDDFNDEQKKLMEVSCGKELCYLNKRKLLVIFKRIRKSEICKYNAKIIINLTKKYEIESCNSNQRILTNMDFKQYGAHYIY